MAYRTILVHLDGSARCEVRVRLAAAMAAAHHGHLVGLVASGRVTVRPMVGGILGAEAMDRIRKAQQEEARQVSLRFEEWARKAGADSRECRVSSDPPGAAMALHGRYADLLVIGQHDAEDENVLSDPALPEDLVLDSGRPTLVVPYAGKFEQIGQQVMVAWDASREAARAVTDALPLLKMARQVEIVVVNADRRAGTHGNEPGADVALFLARHGVKVDVHQDVSRIDVGNTLLSRAADAGTDLIVMGAYGHSRMRELVLGGVTRTILSEMTVPVLMAH